MDNLNIFKGFEKPLLKQQEPTQPVQQAQPVQPIQSAQPTQQPKEQYDRGAIAIARAIRKQESDHNYDIGLNGNKPGGSGEIGAYQFMPETYRSLAKKYIGDENAPATPKNQDELAYRQIKEWKDKGYTPSQIAAIWNMGEPNFLKNGGYENWAGVNPESGIQYDTPSYVNNVMRNFTEIAEQDKQRNASQINNTSQDQTGTILNEEKNSDSSLLNPILGAAMPLALIKPKDIGGAVVGAVKDIGKRGEDVGGAIMDTLRGKINPISGLLQTGGGIAGAIGDVTNRALEVIPGVKQIEGLIGQGFGKLANTEVGQSILTELKDQAEKHPELAKDMEAGFNIASALPILKGLSVAKNVGMDAVASGLKETAEKSFTKDLTTILEKNAKGGQLLKRNPDLVKTILEERALPDIEDGKFAVKEAYQKLSDRISDIDENELQAALKKANLPNTESRIPLEQYRKEAIALAEDELKDPASIEQYFDRLKKKYGDYPTLEQMNEAKRKVAKNISQAGFNSPTMNTDKIVRSTLQKSVEDGARALGLADVFEINQKMAKLIQAQDALKILNNKKIATSFIGDATKTGATVAGEALGNTTGVPFAGAIAGRGIGGYVEKKMAGGLTRSILERTGKNAVRTTLPELKSGAKGLLTGLGINKLAQSKKKSKK